MNWLVMCITLLMALWDAPPRTNQWPLRQNTTPERGYGQWNGDGSSGRQGGFHWALDFHGQAGDTVYSPWRGNGTVLRWDQDGQDPNQGLVLIVENDGKSFGWLYGHINYNDPDFRFREGDRVNRVNLARLYQLTGELGPHLHMSWLSVADFNSALCTGYLNPLLYLMKSCYPFDKAVFSPVTAHHCRD